MALEYGKDPILMPFFIILLTPLKKGAYFEFSLTSVVILSET